MGVVAAVRVEFGDGNGFTTRLGDAMQGCVVGRRKDNGAVPVPGSAFSVARVTQYERCAPLGADRLEFLVGEEADGSAIGRPERIGGTLGSMSTVAQPMCTSPAT